MGRKSRMSPFLRRERPTVLILPVAVFILSLLAVVFARHRTPPEAERAFAAFAANPTQANADWMIRLIYDGGVTQAQGDRMIALILEPQVIVEPSYNCGQPIIIHVRPKNPVQAHDLLGGYTTNLVIAGLTRPEGDANDSMSLDIDPRLSYRLIYLERSFYTFPAVSSGTPGRYPGRVELGYKLDAEPSIRVLPPSFLERLLAKLRLRTANVRLVPTRPLWLECHFSIPIEILVAGTMTRSSEGRKGDILLYFGAENRVLDSVRADFGSTK
jgi:hypothetical protein